jgi:tetratricopeptide (TPR) repeat protein
VSARVEQKAVIKKWAARFTLAIATPLAVLALVELVLHLAGFGNPTGFLLPASGGRSLVQNNRFGWRFFGPQMSRLPEPISLPRPKPPATIRIFVFGESAAFGDPQPAFGLPRFLQAMLELRYPGTKFEVVNGAMTGINSHVVLPIARDCGAAEGDVWVIYMGNNEVVGPYGAGTVFGPQTPPLPLIRASLALKATRTGQLLDAVRQKLQKTPAGKEEWGGMTMFLNQRVAANAPRMDSLYHHFQKNLEDILGAAHKANAAVVLSTVAVNLKDCAPFSSLHRSGLTEAQLSQWQNYFRQGIAAQDAQNWPEATQQFRRAAEIDDGFAELHFRLGQCALALGKTAEASSEFGTARDLDALRFRCDSRLNALIRQAASNQAPARLLLADAEQALGATERSGAVSEGPAAARSENPRNGDFSRPPTDNDALRLVSATQPRSTIPGAELFYEHVHLTFEGNYLLARTIVEQVEKLLAGKLPSTSRAWPELADCARRLGWTDREKQMALTEILGRVSEPPFTFESEHAVQIQRLSALANALGPADSPTMLRRSQAACETALAHWPEDALLYERLAEVKQAQTDHAGAAAAATRSLELLPPNSACCLVLGLALAQQQKFQEAAVAFERVFSLDPQDVWGRQNLAICLQKMGRTDEAIREFKRALEIKPRFCLAWLGLGQIYEQTSRQAEAMDCYRQALANPIHRTAELTTLARFCQSRGWWEAAVTNYNAALILSPASVSLRVDCAQALAAMGRHQEAARRYGEAIALAPDQGQTHFLRGVELGSLGQPQEAEQEFRAAVRLMPELVEGRLNLGISLYQQQKSEEAHACFAEVLQRSPTNALAMKYMQKLKQAERKHE